MMIAPFAIDAFPSPSGWTRSLPPLCAPNKGGKWRVLDEVDEAAEVGQAHDPVGDRRRGLALPVPLGPPHVHGPHAHDGGAFHIGAPRVAGEEDLARIAHARLLEGVLEDPRVGLAGPGL